VGPRELGTVPTDREGWLTLLDGAGVVIHLDRNGEGRSAVGRHGGGDVRCGAGEGAVRPGDEDRAGRVHRDRRFGLRRVLVVAVHDDDGVPGPSVVLLIVVVDVGAVSVVARVTPDVVDGLSGGEYCFRRYLSHECV